MAQSALQPVTADTPAVAARFLPPAAGDGWCRTVSADGTSIAWRRDDPTSPSAETEPTPIVLCNGIACSTGYWSAMAERLMADRPVVRWDYRGHGRSAAPADPRGVGIADVVQDLGAVLAAGGIERAVFVGHSFGVQVALEAVRAWPHRVAGVVAVAGAAGTPLPAAALRPAVGPLDLIERFNALAPDRAADAWRAWWRSPLSHLLARAVGGTSRTAPPAAMQSYYEHVSTRDVGVLIAMMRAMQEHDASAVVADLTVPLLALAGDADGLTPLPVMARLALSAPDGELAVCHGGTHTLPAERPAWVARQMQPLLDAVDAVPRALLSAHASA